MPIGAGLIDIGFAAACGSAFTWTLPASPIAVAVGTAVVRAKKEDMCVSSTKWQVGTHINMASINAGIQDAKGWFTKSLCISPGLAAEASMLDRKIAQTTQNLSSNSQYWCTQTQSRVFTPQRIEGFLSGNGSLFYHGCSAAACGMGRYAAC